MPVTWTEITKDERWEDLSYDQQVAMREKFFEKRASGVARDAEHKEVLREKFYGKAEIKQPVTDKVKKAATGIADTYREIDNTLEFKRRYPWNAKERSYTQQYSDETVKQGKQRTNEDGSTTTVLSKTGQGPDGKWYNVPGFDRDTGLDYESDDAAIQAALEDITGGKVTAYGTSEEADLAAREEHKEFDTPKTSFTVPMGADNFEIPMLPGKTQQESFEAFATDPANQNEKGNRLNPELGTEAPASQPWPGDIDVQFDQEGNLVSGSIPADEGTIVRKAPPKKEKDPYSRYKPDRDATGQIVDEPATTEQALDESYYGRDGKTIISENELPDPVEQDPVNAGINEEFGAWQAKNEGKDFIAWLTARQAPFQDFAGSMMGAVDETLGFVGEQLKDKNILNWILKSEIGEAYKRENPEEYQKLVEIRDGQNRFVDGVFENPELARAAGWLTDKAEVNRRIGQLGRPEQEDLGALYDATGAVPDMAFEIAGGIIGGQKIALGTMALRMYVTEYQRSTRIEGLTVAEAHRNAMVAMASEVLPEIPVFNRWFKKLGPAGKGGAKKILKEMILMSLMEGGSEGVTQLIQIVYRMGGKGEEITIEQAMEEIRVAIKTGAFMGPIMKTVTTNPTMWNEKKWADKQFTSWMKKRALQFSKEDFSDEAKKTAQQSLNPNEPGMALNLMTGGPLERISPLNPPVENVIPTQEDQPAPEEQAPPQPQDIDMSGMEQEPDYAPHPDAEDLNLDQEPMFYEDEQGNRIPTFEGLLDAGYDLPFGIAKIGTNEGRLAAIDESMENYEYHLQEAVKKGNQEDIEFYFSAIEAMQRYKEEFGADAAAPTQPAATNQESSNEEQQVSPESEEDGGRPLREQEGGSGREQGQQDPESQPEEGEQPSRIDRPDGESSTPDQVEPVSVAEATAALEKAEADHQAAWDSDTETRPPGLVSNAKRARDHAKAVLDASVEAERAENDKPLNEAVTRLAELANMDDADLGKIFKKIRPKPRNMGRDGRIRTILQSEHGKEMYFDAVSELRTRAANQEKEQNKKPAKEKPAKRPMFKRKKPKTDEEVEQEEWDAIESGDSYDYGEASTEAMDEVEDDLVNNGWNRVEASTVQGKQHGTFFVNTKRRLTGWVVSQEGRTKLNITESTKEELESAGVTFKKRKKKKDKKPVKEAAEGGLGPDANLSEVFADELKIIEALIETPFGRTINNDLAGIYNILSRKRNEYLDAVGDPVLHSEHIRGGIRSELYDLQKRDMDEETGKLLEKLLRGVENKSWVPNANEIRKRKKAEEAAEAEKDKPKTEPKPEAKPKAKPKEPAKSAEGFPTPNEHGVYSNEDVADGDKMSFESEAKANKIKAEVRVLETENGWVVATSYSHPQGGSSGPLTQSHGLHDTREKALIAGLEALQQDSSNEAMQDNPMSHHRAIEQVNAQVTKALEDTKAAHDFLKANRPHPQVKTASPEKAPEKTKPVRQTKAVKAAKAARNKEIRDAADAWLEEDPGGDVADLMAYLRDEVDATFFQARDIAQAAVKAFSKKPKPSKAELRVDRKRYVKSGNSFWDYTILYGDKSVAVKIERRKNSGTFSIYIDNDPQSLLSTESVFTSIDDAQAFLAEVADNITGIESVNPKWKGGSYTHKVEFNQAFTDRWSNPVFVKYDFAPLKYTPSQMGFTKAAKEWIQVEDGYASTNGKILDWGNKAWYDKKIKGYSTVRNVPKNTVDGLKKSHQKDKPFEIPFIGVYARHPGPKADQHVIFENGKKVTTVNRMYVDHFVGLYGKDIVFKQGGNVMNSVGIYKDGKLVGFIMPIRAGKNLEGKSVQWWQDLLGKKPAAPKPAAKKKPAEPKPKPTPEETTTPQDKIQDFGEKIAGAKKDRTVLSDAVENTGSDSDLDSLPLSKVWPIPNYTKLMEDGYSQNQVIWLKLLRDAVPNKPRNATRRRRYIAELRRLRDQAMDVLDGKLSTEELITTYGGMSYGGQAWTNNFVLAQAVGFPDVIAKFSDYGWAQGNISVQKGEERRGYHNKMSRPKPIWVELKDRYITTYKGDIIGHFEKKGEALEALKAHMMNGKKQGPVEFQAYFKRGDKSGGAWIGKKVGKGYIDLHYIESPDGEKVTWKPINDYIKANHADLVKKLAELKEIPEMRGEDNRPRSMDIDWRNGKPATPEMWEETFGFRGVQFGEYVNQKERQADLNSAYDALMDLSELLVLYPSAMSLNGELALAFGARGQGGKNAAMAHYEHDEVVINLTKNKGAGSLAHEWFHALDNYFSRSRGKPFGMITEDPGMMLENPADVRAEVLVAFTNINQVMQDTGIYERSRKLDRRRTTPYWSTNREMAARAFEAYIKARLEADGNSSDYLANIISEEMFPDDTIYPYPKHTEIRQVMDAFDAFFSALETRMTLKSSLNPEGKRQVLFSIAKERYETKASYSGIINFKYSLDDNLAEAFLKELDEVGLGESDYGYGLDRGIVEFSNLEEDTFQKMFDILAGYPEAYIRTNRSTTAGTDADLTARIDQRADEIWEEWVQEAVEDLAVHGVDTNDIDRTQVSDNLYKQWDDAVSQATREVIAAEEAAESAEEPVAKDGEKASFTINFGTFAKAATMPMQLGNVTKDSLLLEDALDEMMPNLEKGTFRQVPTPKKHARKIGQVEKAFGRKVIFIRVRGEVPFGVGGAVIGKDASRIYVNIEATDPVMAVIGHEMLHTVRIQHPELYQKLALLASARIDNDAYREFANEYRGIDAFTNMSTDAVFEEIVGNLIGDAFMDKAFVDNLIEKDANWFRRLLTKMIQILERMKGKKAEFPLKSNEIFNDIETLQNELKAVLLDFEFEAPEAAPKTPGPQKAALHRANHGSGSMFKQFDMSFINTGEGNQSFGWGLYFAESPGVARSYVIQDAKQLTPDDQIYTRAQMFVKILDEIEDNQHLIDMAKQHPDQDEKVRRMLWVRLGNKVDAGFGKAYGGMWKKHIDAIKSWKDIPTIAEIHARPPFKSHWDINEGAFYEVEIRDSAVANTMDWTETMTDQRPGVADKVYDALRGSGIFNNWEDLLTEFEDMKGVNVYQQLVYKLGGQKQASLYLLSHGITGIRYKDAMSRGDLKEDEGTNNFVMFSDKDVTIIKRNGESLKEEKIHWLDTAGGSVKFARQHTPGQKKFLEKAGMPDRKTRLKDKLDNLYHTEWSQVSIEARDVAALQGVDKFHGFKRAYREHLGEYDDRDGWMLGYKFARLTTGSASTMRGILLYGAPELRDGVISRISGTKGLLDIFMPVNKELDDFMGWRVANRAQRLINTTDAKGKSLETNFTQEDIQEGLDLADGYIEVDGVSILRLDLYKKIAGELEVFQGQILDMHEAAGLIDPLKRAVWEKADWIPFYRQRGKQGTHNKPVAKLQKGLGLSHQTSGIRRLTGKKETLSDPFSNLIMNFTHAVESSMNNTALLRAVDDLVDTPAITRIPSFEFKLDLIPNSEIKRRLLEDLGEEGPQKIKELEAEAKESGHDLFAGIAEMWALQAPMQANVIRVMRGGKAEYYTVEDEMLLSSIVNIDMRSLQLMAPFRAAKTLLTGMVTADPAFMMRNFMRDALQSYLINQDGMIPVVDATKGMMMAALETGGMLDMMFAGGSFQGGYVNGTNPDAALKSIRGALRKKGYSNKYIEGHVDSVIDFTAKGWDKWRKVGDAVENANREAVYERAIKAGKSRLQAVYEAKDLMDFSMQGQFIVARVMSDALPFFNARVQGMYKLGRSGAVPLPGLIAKEVFTKGMYLVFLSLINAWFNYGNDDYDALPEWDKDMYWHFLVGTPFHFRIAKPFELGILFGTIPERMLRLATGEDNARKFKERMAFAFKETMEFDFLHPQLTKPFQEMWENRVLFTGNPIETTHEQQGVLPRGRYNSYTSETMVELGPWLEKNLGLSPKQAQHLVRGYLGTLGNYGLMATDVLTRAIIGAPPVASKSLAEYPVIGAVFRGNKPAWNTRYGTEMYEMHEELTMLMGTVQKYRKENLYAEEEELMSEGDNRELLDLRMSFKTGKEESRHKKDMDKWIKDRSAFQKDIDAIVRDPLMHPETKQEEIYKIVRARNEADKANFEYFSPLFGRK